MEPVEHKFLRGTVIVFLVTCLTKLIVMTSLKIKGTWNEVKGKIKQRYAQLTDDDLTFAEGKEDEMLGRLQKRLGKNKEELRKEIEAL